MDIFTKIVKKQPLSASEIAENYQILDENKQNIVQCALVWNPDIVFELLDPSVDIDNQDKNGQTALQYALARGYKEISNYLIDKNANLNLYDKYENGPLWTACMKKEVISLVGKMLSLGADPDHVNNAGKSPRKLIEEYNIPELLAIFKSFPPGK